MEERIQKIIARAGLASRRRAEEMMTSGLVTVNGEVVTELGTKADASRDHIKVAGKLIQSDTAERVYLMLHKPPDVVSTLSDPEGRPSLRDLLYGVSERVFPVGRLEYHSSGLVFLTNDGDLANRVLQAHNLPQTYQLKLKTLLTFEEVENLSHSTGARVTRIRGKDAPWYEVTLSGVRSDALRNKLFKTGHLVEKMKRTRIANLDLGVLTPGAHRRLAPVEIIDLKKSLDEQRISGRAEARKPDERKPEWRRPESPKPVNAVPPVSAPPQFSPGPAPFRPVSARPAWQKSGGRKPSSPKRADRPVAEPKREWGKRPLTDGRPESRPPAGKPAWQKSGDYKPFAPRRTDGPPTGPKQERGKRVWPKPAAGGRPENRPPTGKPAWQQSGERQPFSRQRADGIAKEPKRGKGKRPWQKPASGSRPESRSTGEKSAWRKSEGSKPFGRKPVGGRSVSGKPANRKRFDRKQTWSPRPPSP